MQKKKNSRKTYLKLPLNKSRGPAAKATPRQRAKASKVVDFISANEVLLQTIK
jgi:hypothetical protein